MVTPIRPVRVEQDLWDGAGEALKGLRAPRRVQVTVRPGMTRTDLVKAVLQAVMRRPS